ncbi:MAG: bifunctional UDP-3-O-[3-hydroxymyristoyl] N-acetylglucosamine deacetylase/3-hydroxyacyl-ACP dehydratase [Bacteroidales bacterium]|nr:bifunctional UDP-3-O-[3-hydroxymyristoyl] N-acetylglucosamine deacetylase/3-hydroxyacyl-ACP dehydratase [Bacteroidales bacterium]
MTEKQKTISRAISLEGEGLHTGQYAKLTFNPAPENFGIIFRRTDLENRPEVEALVENVVDTSRSTSIEKSGARIITVEHVLAAIYGLGIDNLLIDINAIETPILTGNSKPFADALLKAGIVEQKAEKEFFIIKKSFTYSDEEKGIELMTFPDDEYSVHVMIDYHSAVLGHQYATLNELSEFEKEIAPAKTFVFLRELEFLHDNNLIKGGSLDNALVIIEKGVNQQELDRLADKFNKPRMKAIDKGILNEKDLLYSNEPARHKLLDLIGDLALVGMPIKGKILATRPGHASNVEFAKIIRQEIKKLRIRGNVPDIDINAKPVYDINQIKRLLPHRPPFLLVDKAMRIDKNGIVAIKNVTINEPFFTGHFPDEPVMPGVLIVEAMAQAGGILVLHGVDEPEKYSTYFLKIDKVKFKRKVIPGDTLVFKCEYISPMKRGVVTMHAEAYVGTELACEGDLTASIVKNK